VGTSFTATTVTALLALAVLKADVPPPVVASAMPPAVPVLRSQPLKVSALGTLPFQLAAGTKRTRVNGSVPSRRALLLLTAPSAFQLVPPSMLYCQLPLVVSAAVMAMPLEPPASLSLPATRSATSVPALALS